MQITKETLEKEIQKQLGIQGIEVIQVTKPLAMAKDGIHRYYAECIDKEQEARQKEAAADSVNPQAMKKTYDEKPKRFYVYICWSIKAQRWSAEVLEKAQIDKMKKDKFKMVRVF